MKLFSTTAVLVLMQAGFAAAAINTDAVISDFQAQGYTRIEVKTGIRQTKFEAIRGTEKLEVVFDTVTGDVLKSEAGVVRRRDDTTPGVSIKGRKSGLLNPHDDETGVDDDNGDDDNGDDHGSDHDGSDHDGGNHDGGDHDGGDHDGGDHDSGHSDD